ncbi:helix-turn-helix domain-containing protein [Streptomyces sp. SID8361]|nr:helix-turn-helix domain-containing protein [Streptomyces sp. SID8361]
MKSPGKPSLRRNAERLFWREIGNGLASEEAAIAVGASQAAGSRGFRERGGMPTFLRVPVTGRYLSFADRAEIALLEAQDAGVREIARRLGRHDHLPGAAPYRGHPRRQARLSSVVRAVGSRADGASLKTAKLVGNDRLRGYVQERLSGQVRAWMGQQRQGPRRGHGRGATSRGARTGDGRPPEARSRWGLAQGRVVTGSSLNPVVVWVDGRSGWS